MPLEEPIISVSGLRGIIGESLSPELAMRYACAFAGALGPGPLVITRDGRITGPMLADAIRSGLIALGRNVLDAGVAATPTTGVLVRQHAAAGGIQISASHNPPEYNGIKLFGADGRVVPSDVGERVRAAYEANFVEWVSHESIGRLQTGIDSVSEHLKLVTSVVDVERIRARRFKVLLDANHGAGSVLGMPVLEALGCQVHLVGGEPDGHFEHPAEPTEKNLAGLLPEVSRLGVDIAFCQDPDADRLAIVDNRARYIGEEATLALCVDHLLKTNRGPIVINCATSRMSADLAQRYGVPLYQAMVGEANVVAEMVARKALLGGEGNGGVIDPRVGYVRDSFVGMALVLDLMAAREQSIAELADELPRYAMLKRKIPLEPAKVESGLAALEAAFSDAESSRLDGIRFDWPNKWLLVRKSNTEPIVRAIAEAPTAEEATALCTKAEKLFAAL